MAAPATSYSRLVTKHDQVLINRQVLNAEISLGAARRTCGPAALLESLADGYANNVVVFNPTLPFVGRDEEFDLLIAALEDACLGRAVAVFVSGETGVGKSRLLSEFIAHAERQGVAVLRGAAIDVAEGAPFWPVRGALRIFLRNPRHDWAVQLLTPWWEELKEMLPAGLHARAGSYAGSVSTTLDTLVQVVAVLSEHGPLIVVIEDMHWADRSTRELLLYLMANLTDEPVLLVSTYRVDGPSDSHPLRVLLDELQHDRRVRFLELQPLSRESVSKLVETAADSGESSDMAELVWQRSGGNAIMVEEIIHALREGGPAVVPPTLRDLVLRRLNALPPAVQHCVRVLAHGRGPVSHRVLAAVVDLPEQDLVNAIRAAAAASLISADQTGEGYRLRHGIVEEVVIADALPGERIYVNRRYAEALEAVPIADSAGAARIAGHWYRAEEYSRALLATIAAAQDAERLHGYAEASSHWLRALDLLDRLRGVAAGFDNESLTERAASAAHLAGDSDLAVSLLRPLVTGLQATPSVRYVRLHDQLGRYLRAAGRAEEACAVHQRAVAALPDDAPPELVVTGKAGYSEALLEIGAYKKSSVQAREALEGARSSGMRTAQARLLATLGFGLAYLGEPEAGLAEVSEGLRVAEASCGPDDIAYVHQQLCQLLCGPLNRLDEGVAAARRAAARLSELGLGQGHGTTIRAIAANALFRIGRWHEAVALVEEALTVRPSGAAAIELRLARCRIVMGQGQFQAAEEDLSLVEGLLTATVAPRLQIPLLTLRAGLAMWQGQPERARRFVSAGLDIAADRSDDVWVLAPLLWHGLRAEADLAVAAQAFGKPVDLTVLDALRSRMRAEAHRAAGSADAIQASVEGYVQLCEAEASRALGDPDPDVWARAAATWDRNRQPYPVAYAHLRRAEALLGQRTRAAGAVKALTEAAVTARALGAVPLLTEIEALANRANVSLPDGAATVRTDSAARDQIPEREFRPPPTPRQQPSEPPDPLSSLTPRERAVLAALAEGQTNRQIARQLFIAEKTVSVHVSHILAKLGVRTRVQAGALMYRVQLTPPDPPGGSSRRGKNGGV
jgi:DNA-binding CsgD family transcriptional regulator/tetratricopeptide (TPR) repeat protein